MDIGKTIRITERPEHPLMEPMVPFGPTVTPEKTGEPIPEWIKEPVKEPVKVGS